MGFFNPHRLQLDGKALKKEVIDSAIGKDSPTTQLNYL